MNNDMLWMHNEARQGRPSARTMYDLAARYKGARFRVHEQATRLYGGKITTIFKPVIEVAMEVHKRIKWVTYMWLDHEEVVPIIV